jgi:ATP phosphoribosyltransferase regulatory subunit
MPNWLLPEYIADVLPREARKIEELRRVLLDHFRLFGYELVMPPLLEYLESLLSGTGQEMDLHTFKLVDQLSGRTMGIRADMTTQVARIDAHLLNRNSVTRLCYAGSVLRTQPTGFYATREPFQIGAEIYGHHGLEADTEIQQLALACLNLAGISNVRLDLSHIGILKSILALDPLAKKNEAQLFSLLLSKDIPALKEISKNFNAATAQALLALPNLYGDSSVLNKARMILPKEEGITKALNELEAIITQLGETQLTIDLADLRGYHYHSGVMFAIYAKNLPNAIVRGGRYDHVGETFGRARPATGFSIDLRELAHLMPDAKRKRAILAPWNQEKSLQETINSLRNANEIVIQNLPGHENDQDEFDCDRTLVLENTKWVLKNLN